MLWFDHGLPAYIPSVISSEVSHGQRNLLNLTADPLAKVDELPSRDVADALHESFVLNAEAERLKWEGKPTKVFIGGLPFGVSAKGLQRPGELELQPAKLIIENVPSTLSEPVVAMPVEPKVPEAATVSGIAPPPDIARRPITVQSTTDASSERPCPPLSSPCLIM